MTMPMGFGVLIRIALLAPSVAITHRRRLLPAAVVTRRLRPSRTQALPSTDAKTLHQSRDAPWARLHR
jgi:hypothetical protein